MFGYQTVLDKSMNGVKTLSDGKSIITDGVATHDNIIYSNTFKSSDSKTTMTNNTITTETVNALLVNATNISANTETVGTLTCTNLNVDNYGFYVDGFNNNITSSLPTTMNNSLKVVGNDLTIENSNINQIGTTSTNFLKNTSINGSLTCQSDIIQTGGNTVLKNITSDNITMNSNKSINQSGSGISNNLGNTNISNLVVTTSMTFPAAVTIPDAEQTGDLTFTGGARIIQDLTEAGTNYNTLMYSKIAKADIEGNLTQTSGSATLQNTTIQGTAQIQGDITQTAGQSVLKAIGCDQITLNGNKDIYFNIGTGKIDQSVSSGTNLLNSITMNANKNFQQSGTGIINQSGTGTNALKNTSITGTLNVSSTSTLNNVNCGSLTMDANRSITQPTGTTNNQLQTTTISNLTCPIGNITTLSTSSLSVGNVSNTEIQYLDGVIAPIQSQIDSISTTTSGNSTAITGITYNSGTDTTTIDNNVNIPTGKTLSVGSVSNVASNINTLNTNVSNLDSSMNTVFNTISGITYNTVNDTTTIDNNLTINKNLIVQGMNIKEEIDALESSFTTGTINSTNASITNLTTSSLTSFIYTVNFITVLNDIIVNGLTNLGTTTITGLLTCNNVVVNTLATITNMIVTTLTATTITSPSTGNLNITTTNGRQLNLNNNKGSGSGNLTINAGSFNSNVIVENGDVILSEGSLSVDNGIISAGQQITDMLLVKYLYPLPLETKTEVKTNLMADVDKVITSAHSYCGAWLINAPPDDINPNTVYPIISSMKKAGLYDDIFIVCPGYKLVLYRFANYVIAPGGVYNGFTFPVWSGSTDTERQTRTIDNTNGTTFLVKSSIEVYGAGGQVWSVKLYYKNVEISLPYLS